MARRKKKRQEEHENLERWLVSYADFITLLFAFFVTMYAISRVDERKFGSMVESLQRALGSVIVFQTAQREPGAFPLFPSHGKPIDLHISPQAEFKRGEREAFEKLAREIQQRLAQLNPQWAHGQGDGPVSLNQMQYILDHRGLVLRFAERFFFDSGEASIRPEVIPLLDALAGTLQKIRNPVRIEGHTDSVPIHNARFPSNWELSTARATTIVRYLLTRYRFEPNRLSAAGYGEFRPVASNRSEAGRLQNRRVDIVILSGREMQAEPEGEQKAEAL